jgi:hypothetical protein
LLFELESGYWIPHAVMVNFSQLKLVLHPQNWGGNSYFAANPHWVHTPHFWPGLEASNFDSALSSASGGPVGQP